MLENQYTCSVLISLVVKSTGHSLLAQSVGNWASNYLCGTQLTWRLVLQGGLLI